MIKQTSLVDFVYSSYSAQAHSYRYNGTDGGYLIDFYSALNLYATRGDR